MRKRHRAALCFGQRYRPFGFAHYFGGCLVFPQTTEGSVP
jgi:hypothetical protein